MAGEFAADIKAEVLRRKAEATAAGMSPAEQAAGEAAFARLSEAEQRQALAGMSPAEQSAGGAAFARLEAEQRQALGLQQSAPSPLEVQPQAPKVTGSLGQAPEPSLKDKLRRAFAGVGQQHSPGEAKAANQRMVEGGRGDHFDPKIVPRAALNIVSGGATEAVGDAVARAPGQAAEEVSAAQLSQLSPAQLQELMAQANPEAAGQDIMVRRPAGWVPGTRSDASGMAGPDPAATRAALGLHDQADAHALVGQEMRHEAARKRDESMMAVQQNEQRAIIEFKKDREAAETVAAQQRENQIARLTNIQKAMDAVPNAPRTIRQKLEQSGTSYKITMGLAAALSVLGGAVSRDGGRGVKDFLGIVQGNIDRLVQKEADEYARHGERAKMAQNVYAAIRQGAEDDRAALEMTRAMYYDAAINATKQISTQYKLDEQSPQVQDLLEHLNRQRAEAVMKSAMSVEERSSQTDRFDPGGLVKVGSTGKKLELDSEPLAKGLEKYWKVLQDEQVPNAEASLSLYTRAIDRMNKAGFKPDEMFLKMAAGMIDPQDKRAQAWLLTAPQEQREIVQDLVKAGSYAMKDEAGKAVTGNELAMQNLQKGGYSVTSLTNTRDQVAQRVKQGYTNADATAGGRDNIIGRAWQARQRQSQLADQRKAIGSTKQTANYPEELPGKTGVVTR